MSSRLYLDQIYSKSGLTKIIDTSSFDSNNFFESSNTGFKVNYQSSNAALEVIQSGTGNAMTVNTDKFVLDKDGNLNIAGNLTFPNSYGINFGNTILDDLSSSGTGYSALGRYIKIGKMVYIEGEVHTGTRTCVSSYLTIKNIPFITEMTFADSTTGNSAAPTVVYRRNVVGGDSGQGRVQSDYLQITGHSAAGAVADFSYSCFFMVI
jgi:hypothetical protein